MSMVAVTQLPQHQSTRRPHLSAPLQAFPGVDVPKSAKPRVVVLGSGWGAISFMKALRKDVARKYDIVLLSPRNYFLYTPLLPAVATGTMEERSIVEPVRNVVIGKGEFYEAVCQNVDPENKQITACFPKDSGFPEACFRMSYDHLIVSVGSVNNTFGISGVKENCFFFKSIDDASRLRSQVSECFERASLPYTPEEVRPHTTSFLVSFCSFCAALPALTWMLHTSGLFLDCPCASWCSFRPYPSRSGAECSGLKTIVPLAKMTLKHKGLHPSYAAQLCRGASVQDRKKMLSFVVVGGGPTGVEVAAEMYDMVTQDMNRLYPNLMKDVKIRVVELMDYVLSTYDRKIGEYTAKLFKRNGIELVRCR
jgi:NADH dehydrogenase FAD-containing subunit